MAGEFTHIRAVLAAQVPDVIVGEWQRVAQAHRATGQYAADVSFQRVYPYGGSELACAVLNVSPHAEVLERGHGGYHLPSVIDWGAAEGRGTAKRTKEGRRYLTIAFRHYTSGSAAGGISSARARAMMPTTVSRAARTLHGLTEPRPGRDPIALRSDRERAEAARAAVALRAAGTRLSRPYELLAQMFPNAGGRGPSYFDMAQRARHEEGQPGYTWRSRTYEGLRPRVQTNPATGRTSSAYQTLRTLTEDSTGWFVPPMPGRAIAARTVAAVTPIVRTLVADAAREDLVELVHTWVGDRAA